jgi:hypothetical protein
MVVRSNGQVETLPDSFLGIDTAKIEQFVSGSGFTIAAVRGSSGRSLNFSLVNLETHEISKIQKSFKPRQEIPSYEDTFYGTQFALRGSELLINVQSVGYSDTFYAGSTHDAVGANGIRHLSCFLDPQLGHIEDILITPDSAPVLALVATNQSTNLQLVRFDSLDTTNYPNRCVKVRAKIDSECRASFDNNAAEVSQKGFATVKNTIPFASSCAISMQFLDAGSKPIAGAKVALRRNGRRRVVGKKTNAQGKVRLNLSAVTQDFFSCGWSVFLEDLSRYQPNGIVIFRYNGGGCRRI